jgi:hypothetical protein
MDGRFQSGTLENGVANGKVDEKKSTRKHGGYPGISALTLPYTQQ